MKKLLSTLLAAALMAALLVCPAWAIDLEPGTGAGFYVRDTADVLSSETEQTVAEYNAVLESECSDAQLVVVTVPYLNEDADLAATELMNDWGVGSASQSNGMLLLLAANQGRGWLAVGAGLSRDFDDETAGQYLDAYFWDEVDAGRPDEAVQTLTARLYDWYLDYYGVSAYEQAEPYPGSSSAVRGVSTVFKLIGVLLMVIVVIWLLGAASRFIRMRSWGYTGGFFPIFWFGGRRRYNDWYRRQPPPPPPGPRGPGGPAGFGGPGGFMGGGFPGSRPNRRPTSASRPSRPRGGGFGGFSSGSGAGRSGGSSRGGFRGGGFGGHSGGGGAGRR